MSRQWLRRMSFTFSGGRGRAIYGGRDREPHLVASIEATTIQSPNAASLRIWNPSPTLINQANEFTRVEVRAGYDTGTDAPLPLIYAGDIKQPRYGKESNAVDTYLDMFCSDGGNAYQQARVSKTLAAGYTPMDKVNAALDAMRPFGITMGLVTADLSKPQFPRGIPLIGMARSLLRETALSAGALWSIQDGRLCVVDHKKPLPGTPIVLNSRTGLILRPEQTTDGIKAQFLSRSDLHVHSLVHIDQASINRAERDNNIFTGGPGASPGNFDLNNTGLIATDGIYQVIALERQLDTRGQAWYDYITCIAQKGGNPNQGQLDAGQGKFDTPTLAMQ